MNRIYDPKVDEIYRHSKTGNLYEIKAVGRMAGENTIPMVAYRALYKDESKDNNYDVWFRTLSEFNQFVKIEGKEVLVPRFERVV